MFHATQAWFSTFYVMALTVSIITRHHWRFIATNIASLATVVALAACGVRFRASLAMQTITLDLLNVELPYNLHYIPICFVLGFAASLYFCDSVAFEVYGKRLFKKAIIATLLSSVVFALNMALFLAFGYVMIAIPYFWNVCIPIFTVAVLAQFFFTLTSNCIDALFCRLSRFRPLYILVFLLNPLGYTFAGFYLFTSGMLNEGVSAIEKFIEPVSFDDLKYIGVAVLVVLFVWLGKISVDAGNRRHAILFDINYILGLVVPVIAITVSILKGHRFNGHRTLSTFLQGPYGFFCVILLVSCTIALCLLPLFLGQPVTSSAAKKQTKTPAPKGKGKEKAE